MKKILLTIAVMFLGTTLLVNAQQDELFYDVDGDTTPSTDVGTYLHDDVVDNQEWFLQRVLNFLNLNQYASGTNPDTGETFGATNFLVRIINLALSLSAFIALVVLLYGFSMILFGTEEDGIARAKKYIFWAAVAIGILGVSWFIVSAIFYIYSQVANG